MQQFIGSIYNLYSAIVSSTQWFALYKAVFDQIFFANSKWRSMAICLWVICTTCNLTMLHKTFRPLGPICFVQVCRDSKTNLSREFAYVNLRCRQHAQNALSTLIFTELMGKAIRMWVETNSTLGKSGNGNIVIKGLARNINNLALYRIFLLPRGNHVEQNGV